MTLSTMPPAPLTLSSRMPSPATIVPIATGAPLRPSVLVVDDEPGIRVALAAHFAREGWAVQTAATVREATTNLDHESFDLVVCDVCLTDGDGFTVLRASQAVADPPAFLFVTAFGSVPQAVEAMQHGAVDYLSKPASFDHLHALAKKVMAARQSTTGIAEASTGGIVGRSRALETALARARAAARTDSDVLVEAESGTGKELLARMIHNSSARRDGPFIAINCAALPESLLESELFGHARGAFTGAAGAKAGKFELAHGGTILLDEIGDMPLGMQPKLLRVLQERVVERLGESRTIHTDIRVIATTNVQLESIVERGLFRGDLFYRLNVIPLTLPPLLQRLEDLPLLAEHFARSFAQKHGVRPVHLRADFLERLSTYHWPGNVRELANFMQRVLSLYPAAELTAACFDSEHRPTRHRELTRITSLPPRADLRAALPATPTRPASPVSMDELERIHLERTLELVQGNRTRAAEMLGLSVRTVRNKIRQYDLPPRRYA